MAGEEGAARLEGLPLECAARRSGLTNGLQQRRTCAICTGRYSECFGSYGMRNVSNNTWHSGVHSKPDDLTFFPESPNARWCCQACEDTANSFSPLRPRHVAATAFAP